MFLISLCPEILSCFFSLFSLGELKELQKDFNMQLNLDINKKKFFIYLFIYRSLVHIYFLDLTKLYMIYWTFHLICYADTCYMIYIILYIYNISIIIISCTHVVRIRMSIVDDYDN